MYQIESERVRSGMTQAELGNELHVSRVTVANWENGRSEPATNKVVSMADMFGCSTDYLLGRTDERLPR